MVGKTDPVPDFKCRELKAGLDMAALMRAGGVRAG